MPETTEAYTLTRELRPSEYWCSKCQRPHSRGVKSEQGQKHLQFEGPAPAVTPKADPPGGDKPPAVCPECNGTGVIEGGIGLVALRCSCGIVPREDAIREPGDGDAPAQPTKGQPRSEERCHICHDTGYKRIGDQGQARIFCECGHETYEERIGIMARRGHHGPMQPLTLEETARRDQALTVGIPRGGGGAGGAGGGDSESAAGEPGQSGKQSGEGGDAA